MSHIFVSYSRADKDYVMKLVDSFESKGYDVWYDLEMFTGDEWADRIKARIDNCDAFIVVMTQNSEESVWVKREVLYAMQKKKRIFPLLLQGELWMLLQDKNYANVMGGVLPDEKFFRHLSTIVPRNSDWEIREKARLAAEEAERERIRKEKEEREAAEKLQRKIDKRKKDIQSKYKREIFFSRLRNKLGLVFLYFRYYIFPAILILGVMAGGYYFWKPFFDKAMFPAQEIAVVQASTTQPDETKVVIPSETIAPTSTPTKIITPTPTPLPTEITDVKGTTMRLVPEGEFTMGSNANDDEKPIHQVYLDAFYMDIYEVTNASYKECEEVGVCSPPGDMKSSYYLGSEFHDYPVLLRGEWWDDANAFCEWRGGSLPTEAQWEKAARGMDGRTYPWGEGIDCSKANYKYDGTNYCVGGLSKVGSYENGKSPYGMYDMSGNAWEWVLDWYDKAYYDNSPSSNPLGPNQTGPYDDYGDERVVRGGSWFDYFGMVTVSARAPYRHWGEPPNLYSDIGFRCIKDAQ